MDAKVAPCDGTELALVACQRGRHNQRGRLSQSLTMQRCSHSMRKMSLLLWTVLVSGPAAAGVGPQQGPACTPSASSPAPVTDARWIRSPFANIELAPIEPRPDGGLVLRLTIHLRKGVHIFAPDQRGYYPLSIAFPEGSAIKAGRLELPAPAPYVFTPTGERFLVYEGMFAMAQHVTVASGRSRRPPARVPALLRYQACDDRVCFKPQTVELVWTSERPGEERR
jgi:hypothetical protein